MAILWLHHLIQLHVIYLSFLLSIIVLIIYIYIYIYIWGTFKWEGCLNERVRGLHLNLWIKSNVCNCLHLHTHNYSRFMFLPSQKWLFHFFSHLAFSTSRLWNSQTKKHSEMILCWMAKMSYFLKTQLSILYSLKPNPLHL
jgi:hypothetical protein